MIEDILDVSRIIRGKLNLSLRPINLVPVVDAAVDAVQLTAEAKSIQLEYILDPSVDRATAEGLPLDSSEELTPSNLALLKGGTLAGGIVVNGDPDRLQQIVWNLLTNAIKFTPEGGKVEVRCLRANSHVQIQVIDTGMGISPEFLPHVFDRFRQADSTTTRTHGGLGLGLAIVRNLVALHGGTVHAESEGEGKGATFTVKLPLLNKAQEQGNGAESEHSSLEQPGLKGESDNFDLGTSAEAPGNLSGLQVLVVDDEPDVRSLLITVIEESGANAIAAESVPEALKVLEQLQPDVLVSDIAMPLEDGYTLIRKVRNLEAERGGLLPAVALTAYVREEDCQQAIEAGFQMHISKPVDTTKLVMAVANLAGRTLTVTE
jgi:CheY-like chemotaxis protein